MTAADWIAAMCSLCVIALLIEAARFNRNRRPHD
jgi:hypothetical protein